MKRLNHHWIKSDKNYRSYYLKSQTVVLYILNMSAYQMNCQLKNSQKFWWILHNNQHLDNNYVFCKYYYSAWRKLSPTSEGRSNLKLTHFSINNQNPTKILKMCKLKVQLKKIYENMKIITGLLDSLNNNYRNFYPIWSNEFSISSKDNEVSKCHHLFHIF